MVLRFIFFYMFLHIHSPYCPKTVFYLKATVGPPYQIRDLVTTSSAYIVPPMRCIRFIHGLVPINKICAPARERPTVATALGDGRGLTPACWLVGQCRYRKLRH